MTKFLKTILFSQSSNLKGNMNYGEKRPLHLAALFFSILLMVACERPEESIGIDLQPDEDILGASGVDTFTVKAFSLAEDSIFTDNVITGLVGAYIDPEFGFVKSGHTSELRLTSSNPQFFLPGSALENLVIDSLILNLSFDLLENIPLYGSTGEQYFQVFEVLDSLDLNAEYYSNTAVNLDDEDLVLEGHNMQSPDYLNPIVIDSIESFPSIRIPLKTDLGQRIFDASADDGLSASEFVELIKGLHITVDENAGGVDLSRTGINLIDVSTGLSRMELYYRDTLDFINDSDSLVEDTALFYDFEIRAATGKFNGIEHDFLRGGNPNLVRQVVNGKRDEGRELLYAQSAAGTKLRVDLPHIEELREIDGIALAKAELILPVNEISGGRFPVPARLLLFGLDENEDAFVLDEFLQDPTGFTFIDGSYDPQNEQYRFIITRFLQQVLNGDRDFNGFEIVVQRASTTANRVVLNGAENANEKLRLEIVFTNF
ncbi:MAG: DUF4270 family protein [Bacteroidota bacterium]